MGRHTISRKLRFEVFKRDSFTCQYCGAKAPDVVLQVDHVVPASKGGTDDILNLVTACKACNSGKSNRELSDNSVLAKQRSQLEELQERKEQIEMLFEWQKGLIEQDRYAFQKAADFWAELVAPYALSETGKRSLDRLTKKYGLGEIIEAMRVSVEQYVEYDGDKPTHESVEKAWRAVRGICSVKRSEKQKPHLSEILYIRGILRNRLDYVDERLALQLLDRCVQLGASIDSLKRHAIEVGSWTQWRRGVESFIEDRMSEEGSVWLSLIP